MTAAPLIQYLESYLPFDEKEKKLLDERFLLREIKKKEKILSEGNICRHYTFIVKGCFRMYGIDEKGCEHNIQFAAENDWITDISGFHTKKPSRLNIQAIETSSVLQIEQQDLYFLYLNITKLDRIFKVILENKNTELQSRLLQNFSSTARQRYTDFLEQYPTLANRLPDSQIASYLGITPEFLSKVRKELSQK